MKKWNAAGFNARQAQTQSNRQAQFSNSESGNGIGASGGGLLKRVKGAKTGSQAQAMLLAEMRQAGRKYQ